MIAYFDCFSGISGDMTLGAFVDLGVPFEWLEAQLSRLPLDGFQIRVADVRRNGIAAKNLTVAVDESAPARNWRTIRQLIGDSPLSEAVRERSLDIFGRIARAEAAIHSRTPDHVHFHEVGGVDALVDIVGTSLCVEYLGIEKVFSGPIPLGNGMTRCSHGTIPVPVPATVAILENVPVYGAGVPFEMVMPTGAAIVASLAAGFGPMPAMAIRAAGYGAGDRELDDRPNLLRILLGEEAARGAGRDTVWVVETNIDDMNPELFGHLMETLFADGALDVFWMPIQMKKNRPATLVRVLCREAERDAVIRRIQAETTTAGVRFHEVERSLLDRRADTVETEYGPVAVKRVAGPDGRERVAPEYEACRIVARKKGVPLKDVYAAVLAAAGWPMQFLDKETGRQ